MKRRRRRDEEEMKSLFNERKEESMVSTFDGVNVFIRNFGPIDLVQCFHLR